MIMSKIVFIFVFTFIFLQLSFANGLDTTKIQVNSEGYLLDGILLKNSKGNEKIPVVIFLVGSGANSSHETSYKDFIKYFFEETFLMNDYALVYFDKRGVGKSEGLWYNTTFEQRALDAKNVALAIQKFEFVDHENIYVIGHSQGGWIVQVALAEYPEIFAGGISMAGPSFGVKKQLINDYQSKFICEKGLDENTALRKASRRVNRELFLISLFGIKGNLKQLKVIKNFEAEPYLKQIKKPFLMLFAENDALVNLKWSMDALGKMFPDGLPSHIQVYEAKGQTHSFKTASKCFDAKEKSTYAETTRQFLFDWVHSKN